MYPRNTKNEQTILKRVVIGLVNLLLLGVLLFTGSVILQRSASAQSSALFIPPDSLVYQGKLTGLNVATTATGIAIQAQSTENIDLVKSQSQVISGAKVTVRIPEFHYQTTLSEVASGQYQTAFPVDLAVTPSVYGTSGSAMATISQWSVVPQAASVTLGTSTVNLPTGIPIRLSSVLSGAQVLANGRVAVPPVTGFIPNAGLTTQSTGSSYTIPASLSLQAQVLDAQGKPVANRQLAVTLSLAGAGSQTIQVTTDGNGDFSFSRSDPANVSVSGGRTVDLPAPFQIQGATAQEVSAFWWGGTSSGPTQQQQQANLGPTYDPVATGGADPVNIITGNVWDTEKDLSYPSRGIPFSFVRTYNSQDTYVGPFGQGWTFSYNINLTPTGNGTMTEMTATGSRVIYTSNGNGTFSPPAGHHSTLTLNSDGSYTLKNKYGVVDQFNPNGQLLWIQDPNGNRETFSYQNGHLTTITDTVGRKIQLSYNSTGEVTGLTDPLGQTIAYGYNGNGQLAQVTYPGGSTVQYSYDANGELTQITDPNGNSRQFTYNSQGQATIFQYNGGLEKSIFSYNSSNDQTTVTDAQGFQTVYDYQYIDNTGVITKIVNPMDGVTTFQWDQNANKTAVTDASGHTTQMTYDGEGNVTSITDPLGNTTTLQYNPIFNKPTVVTNPMGHSVTVAYDVYGNPVSVTDPLGHSTSFSYGSFGELLQATNSLGRTTHYQYTPYGDVVSITNAMGKVTQVQYDGMGYPTAITDPLHHAIQYQYDGQYRLTAITYPNGGTARLSYDPVGNVVSVTDPNGNTTKYTYNQADELLQKINALGQVTQYAYNPLGLLQSVTNAAGNADTFTYNPLGELVKEILPSGTFIHYQYDPVGNVTAVTGPGGHTYQYAYDALNRLVQVTDPLGGITKYAYDPLGDMTSATDPNGHTRTYSYNADRQVISATNPLGNTWKYGYNSVGSLATVTDAMGQTTNFSYDPLQQLTQVSYPGNLSTQYAYDAVGNLVKMVDGQGTTTYGYNSMNQLVSESLPGNLQLGFGYDPSGNQTSLTTPVGTTSYAYNALNQLTQVTTPLGGVTKYQYSPIGQVVSQTNPNGTSTGYQYDSLGQLVRLTNQGPHGIQSQFAYQYDNSGNRVSMTRGNLETTYQYDALNRLTGVNYPTGLGVRYGYDAAGNRTNRSTLGHTTTYTYNAADELLKAGKETYTYNADGELTSQSGPGGTYTYVWNGQHLLTEVKGPRGTVTYGYDGFGRLVTRQAGKTPALQNVYDGLQLLMQHVPGSHAWTQYVNANGQAIGTIAYGPGQNAGHPQYFQYDALGSLIGVTNQQGNLTGQYAYSPFGRPLTSPMLQANAHAALGVGGAQVGVAMGAALGNPHNGYQSVSYIGQPYDPATGLSYFNARWYAPGTGRFMSQDPAAAQAMLPATMNRYVYALNNPVLYEDPLGLMVRSPNMSDMLKALIIVDPAGTMLDGLAQSTGVVIGRLSIELGFMWASTSLDAAALQGVSSDVWQLNPLQRGWQLEQPVAQALKVPLLEQANYPVIDSYSEGVITSIKSVDLNSSTYSSPQVMLQRLEGYVNKLNDLKGLRNYGRSILRGLPITDRQLALVVPRNSLSSNLGVLKSVSQYGADHGVIVKIFYTP